VRNHGGPHAHDVARELADHVAARNPRGQHEALPFWIGRFDGDGDVKKMCAGLRRPNGVGNGHERGRTDGAALWNGGRAV